jgi:hypothetical protein
MKSESVMYPGCVEFDIPPHTKLWYDFRTVGVDYYAGGVGASECGKICGLDPYRPSLPEMFYHKVGMLPISHEDNELTFWGRQMEMPIITTWQFHDGTDEGYVRNKTAWEKAGTLDSTIGVFRTATKKSVYLVNEKYPHLFISLDASIDKGMARLDTGEILDNYAPLEAKNLSFWAYNTYEDNLPRKHLYQMQQQMLVCDAQYGELVYLVAGNQLKVRPFERNDDICEEILKKSFNFWNDRVLPAREAYLLRQQRVAQLGREDLEDSLIKQADRFIMSLEPFDPGNEEDLRFRKARYQRKYDRVEGTADEFYHAAMYKILHEGSKSLEEKARFHKSHCAKALTDNQVRTVLFAGGKKGRISFSEDSKLLIRADCDSDSAAFVKAIEQLPIGQFLKEGGDNA